MNEDLYNFQDDDIDEETNDHDCTTNDHDYQIIG